MNPNRAEGQRQPADRLEAYQFHLPPAPVPLSNTKNSVEIVKRMFLRAIVLDPNYARAYAMLSATYMAAWIHPLDNDCLSAAALERAHRFARKAVQLDPNLPIAHAQLGTVLTFEDQHEQSIAQFEKAIALNPIFTEIRHVATFRG